MQRGSDRLSRHRDDEMKHELQGLLRSGHPTRSEEWNDPEPTADDDPQVWGGPVAPGSAGASLETVRLELARVLSRGSFPATAGRLARVLRRENAPDVLVEAVEGLPPKESYGGLQELARALTATEGAP
ncbi:DUF2795 domain-containing protein [Streptomyces sp. SID13726]|uniref:DUF2795 domain-containing protein n=1 Tax=Streptomyces sp. SID13726 TaxID=2706058 RepID=UPI0013BD68D1|nr:DUF2795 domain-containing protein [Streptomyces sp. SID13726]NEB05440.1 DUF2795 domain-containing protein [Streptomyces sp. SID13726]